MQEISTRRDSRNIIWNANFLLLEIFLARNAI